MPALAELARQTQEMQGPTCRFVCPSRLSSTTTDRQRICIACRRSREQLRQTCQGRRDLDPARTGNGRLHLEVRDNGIGIVNRGARGRGVACTHGTRCGMIGGAFRSRRSTMCTVSPAPRREFVTPHSPARCCGRGRNSAVGGSSGTTSWRGMRASPRRSAASAASGLAFDCGSTAGANQCGPVRRWSAGWRSTRSTLRAGVGNCQLDAAFRPCQHLHTPSLLHAERTR